MPVPKRKTSAAKRDRRRSHHALVAPAVEECPECGESKLRHRTCPHCGKYRGRQVVEIED